MDLRHTTGRPDGTVHTSGPLGWSVRRGRSGVQQTVTHLGERDAQGRARAKALARAMGGELEQGALVTAEAPDEAAGSVRWERGRLERGRRFGDVWLASTLWRALPLDPVRTERRPPGREAVPWGTRAAILMIARLGAPASERPMAEEWSRQTA